MTKTPPKTQSKPKTKSKATKNAWYDSPRFAKFYALFSVVALLATTTYWSTLSARIQLSNADQLANSFLMEHGGTFRGASLPGAHSFFIKWPLFWLVQLFGATPNTFIVLTVLTTLATVGLFALILYKLNSRALIFGTICLALASVLLLIPTLPFSGGLLPVNMAMLTTRNLEYILYIGIMMMLVHHPRMRSAYFWLAAAGLSLLIASDKLFLSLSLAASLMALVVYSVLRQWQLVSRAVHWVVASVVGAVGSILLIWSLTALHLTHIINQGEASPYGLVHGLGSLINAAIYAALGLLTNLGANPAAGTSILRQYPGQAASHLLRFSGLAYALNIVLFLAGGYMVFRLLRPTLHYVRKQPTKLNEPAMLAVLMTWASLAAVTVFVGTNHYYAGDARYLTIVLFTVFIAAAAYLKNVKVANKHIVFAGGLIGLGILVGLTVNAGVFHTDKQVLQPIDQRNQRIVGVLQQHPVDVFVGDYWRVLPIKLQSNNTIKVMPLAGCVQGRDTLTSSAWQPNLSKHSFAYLLSQDKGLSDFPHCTLSQVVNTYGRPNASALIAGDLSHPKEQVLFYDLGAHKSAPITPQPTGGPATVVPVTTDELTNTGCSGPSIVTVVAHQDDDLLFTNPDIIHHIKNGDCIRTVYVTAGDDGKGEFYWLGREKGSQAAYDSLIGFKGIWVQRIVKLAGGQYVTISNPRGNKKISLIFMHLPDGNMKGQGFGASHDESLEKLDQGHVAALHTIDGQSTYTGPQLVAGIAELLNTFQASEIHTQSNLSDGAFADHSDHMAVGRFAKKAYAVYEKKKFDNQVVIPIKYYIGYPIHGRPANVSGADLDAKEAAFFAYAKFDPNVCSSLAACRKASAVYTTYLERQYTNPY